MAEEHRLDRIHYFGDYIILGEIAAGGMGVVYLARQTSLGREVALKLINSGLLASQRQKDQFRIEAEAAASLSHPNIVAIYEAGEHAGLPFVAMEYIAGASLAEQISEGRWSIPDGDFAAHQRRVARLMAQLSSAVDHAHQSGILHRDLKPGNVLISPNGEPVLTDFGLAKFMDSGGDPGRTRGGLGTLAYMPPEQADSRVYSATIRSDVYGLGAILYELLAGRPPFIGSESQILQRLLAGDLVRPRILQSRVDRELETICLKCLELSPGSRYGSAAEVQQELERFLRHEPILARRATAVEKVRKWIRRNPARAAAAGTSSLVLLFGILAVGWQWRRAEAGWSAARATTARLRMQQVEALFERGERARAVAVMAMALRESPDSAALQERLVNYLSQNSFLVPIPNQSDASSLGSQRSRSSSQLHPNRPPDLSPGRWEASIGPTNLVILATFAPNAEPQDLGPLHAITADIISALTKVTASSNGVRLELVEIPIEGGANANAVRSVASLLDPKLISAKAPMVAVHESSNGLEIWNPRQTERAFFTQASPIQCAAFVMNSRGETNLLLKIATGGQDGWIRLWDLPLDTNKMINGDWTVQMNGDAAEAAVMWGDFPITKKHLRTLAETHPNYPIAYDLGDPSDSFFAHHGSVTALRCVLDGRILVSAGDDRMVSFWAEQESGYDGRSMVPRAFPAPILDISIEDASGRFVVSNGAGDRFETRWRKPRKFSAADGARQNSGSLSTDSFPPRSSEIHSVTNWTFDRKVYSVAKGRSVQLFEAQSGIARAEPFEGVDFAVFSRDDRWLAAGSTNGYVRLFSTAGDALTEWMWCGGPIADIAFSGSALVTSAGHLTDLHRAAGRAPDWLPDLAEALVGLKVTENGAFEALSHAAAGESCGRAAAKIRMDGFRGLYWVREVLGWNIIPAGSSTAAPIEN